jgi:FdrA protein
MTAEHVESRAGAYADSVTLMAVSARAQSVAGVQAALVAMGTELNVGLLADLGFAGPPDSGPNDLIVAVRADDADALAAALVVVDHALAGGDRDGESGTGAGAATPARTTSSAVRRSGPGIALISVPGRYAYTEALDALEAGCDVMIFSDNVPVEHEIALKENAAARGLLVMGPDCGTAIVGGIGLGFSHSVPAGPVGIVAASGTGAQQVICLLDAAGVGVSAVLGVGGRDLSAAVGARSARAALAALDADPATELILVISKPPDASVGIELRSLAAGLETPVQFALIGHEQPDLTAATEALLRATGHAVPPWPRWGDARSPVPRQEAGSGLRGLFAGGTLCEEAAVIASARLGAVYSNVPLRAEWLIDPLAPSGPGRQHVLIDFGDDELTAGRPHPMIDQRLRLSRLAGAAADPATGVILLDVVLGHGAHPDPASELAPAIAAALTGPARDGLAVVVSLIGTRSDPQIRDAQAAALANAGAQVFASNAEATRFACDLIEGGG